MEENNQNTFEKKPIRKKWWFWVIIAVLSVIFLTILSSALISAGVIDPGVKVNLEGEDNKLVYEPSFYYLNNEFKVKYELDDFEYTCEKTFVNDDGYVFYDVTIKYSLSCQLKLNNKNYNDDTITFNPCIVFYSTNNENFEKVIKTMTVSSGHEYDFSFKIKDVCGGKEKELPIFDYYVKLSVPANE